MSLINNKKELVKAVGIIIDIDMGIQDLAFPSVKMHKGREIEYDMAVVEGTTVSYNSFAKTSNTIIKDGKSKVTISPVNLNNSISKDVIEADAEKFGQNEYGEGTVDAQMESVLNGVGKIRLNHRATEKALTYEALTTHQIAGGYEDVNGTHDIVFAVPGTNKKVLTNGAGEKYWSDSEALPLTNIRTAVKAMKVKPSFIIMNDDTYANFVNNAEVVSTSTNTTKPQNFYINETVEAASMFFRAGRIIHMGMIIDVYVERQTKSDNTPYMPTEFVVFSSPIGELNYGGIPIAENGGIRNIVAQWDASESITLDPPQHKIVVRTAPLPTLKNGEGYYSLRVEA